MLGHNPISSAPVAARAGQNTDRPRMCVEIDGATLAVAISGCAFVPAALVGQAVRPAITGKADCS